MLWFVIACRHPPAPLPVPDGPTPSELVLDGGVHATLVANSGSPGIVWSLVVDAGGQDEPVGQEGVAHFVEHMAFNGTRRFPGTTLVDWLEDHGMPFGRDLNAWTSETTTAYTLYTPTADVQVIETIPLILRDWVDGVTFDPVEVERERGVVLSEHEQRQGALMAKLLDRPFVGGTQGSIAAITRDDLVHFHRTWYRSDRIHVFAVGDFDPATLEQQLRAAFAGLVPEARIRALVPAPSTPAALDPGPDAEGPRFRFVPMPSSPDLAAVLPRTAHLIARHRPQERVTAMLLAEVLRARLANLGSQVIEAEERMSRWGALPRQVRGWAPAQQARRCSVAWPRPSRFSRRSSLQRRSACCWPGPNALSQE